MAQIQNRPDLNRRELMALAGAGVLAIAISPLRPGRADLPAMQARLDELVAGRTVQEGRITFDVPQIAENGATVPVTIEVQSPMTADDHVTALHILSERNPVPQVASFHFSPRSGRALVSTRIRLAESQRVHALAEMSDGSLFATAREVQVTIGGCGG